MLKLDLEEICFINEETELIRSQFQKKTGNAFYSHSHFLCKSENIIFA